MIEEELLRRYLVPLQDVEATRTAGPAKRSYRFVDDGVPDELVAGLLGAQRVAHAHVEIGDSSITLRR